ncbi:uncharacterized protein M6B38_288775 [Iris pallida]|uniref:Uncharacterized protein n=1 Tax=Iris pallida TaxID=29817 RepID=A0AAX6HWD8_IRIPA|nr:uncharacterized protein M6B38_288775 [Iris pallida]
MKPRQETLILSLSLQLSLSKHSLSIQGTMEWAKNEYTVYEDLAVAKIKEGILVAASHPELSSGMVAGVGLVVLKRPRRFLIRKTRSLFMSEESLLSDAEAKMSKVRQSVNLVQNESRKLEERALKAEQEMKRGREALIKEGREIRGELRYINRIEKETMGLKELMRELPRRETSRFRSEISSLASQLNQEKKALTSTASRIINKGISI